MNEIMIDLETLGIKPGCVILTIGAVFFDSEKIGEAFYKVIDLEDSVNNGFYIRPKTVLWWLEQSKEAQQGLLQPGESVGSVLYDFKDWVERFSDKNPLIWGNGSDFDNEILSAAYSKYNIDKPWGDFSNRCYRTLKNEFPNIKIERFGTHHNSLNDAISQANHLIKIRQHILSLQAP